MINQFKLFIASALLLFAGAAMAAPYEDGIAAFERGDYQLAAVVWRALAEQGDAKSQFALGLLYLSGKECLRATLRR
jgi:TPR repeat protein